MSAPFVPALDTFVGGQMTDLPAYTGGLDLTALFEMVSPGNPAQAVNYSVTLQQLSNLIAATIVNAPTFVTSVSVYNSVATDIRILIDKTIGSPTTVNLLDGANYLQPVLVKDLKGDADVNPITVTFPGTYDGVASPLTIDTRYGWIWFNPLPGGNFYAAD